MKIQDSITTFKFSNFDIDIQGSKIIKKPVLMSNDESVKVSISEEGLDRSRANMIGSQSFDGMVKQRELLTEIGLSTDLNYNFKLSEKINALNNADKKMQEGESLSTKDKFENIAEAYALLYDEIMQGYENGTREINVVDNDSELGYRTITMEEELSALDEAYEKAVNNTVGIVKQAYDFKEAFEKYKSKLERIGASRAELANAYAAQDKKAEMMPEDIIEKMMNIRDSWKNNYTTYSQNVAWQGVLSVINEIFQ